MANPPAEPIIAYGGEAETGRPRRGGSANEPVAALIRLVQAT